MSLNAQRARSAIAFGADLLDVAALPGLVTSTVTDTFGQAGCPDQQCVDLLSDAASARSRSAQWDDLIGTNLRAPLFLSQAAAPQPAASTVG